MFLFFNDTSTTELYTYCPPLSLHDALPILRTALPSLYRAQSRPRATDRRSGNISLVQLPGVPGPAPDFRPLRTPGLARPRRQPTRTQGSLAPHPRRGRSEEHTSELQSLMSSSYAVICLKTTNKPAAQYRKLKL